MVTNKPLVSIIIPVYNVSQYLDQCIESLVNQTLQDIELIFIDDKSTDNSLAILNDWAKKDERIIVVALSDKKFIGGARNIGIRMANADYLGFVDSDDFVASNMYELLIGHSNGGNADVVIGNTFCQYVNHDESTLSIRSYDQIKDLNELKRQILLYGCRLTVSVFKKSLFFDNDLFFPEKCHFEDNAIVPCLYMQAESMKVVESAYPLYFYRITPSSVTHVMNNYRLFDRIKNSNIFLDNTKRLGIYDLFPNEVKIRYYDLIYRITLIHVFNTFTVLPTHQLRKVIKEYGSLAKQLKKDKNPYLKPYYRGDSLGNKLQLYFVRISAKFPFVYVPLRKFFLLCRKIRYSKCFR